MEHPIKITYLQVIIGRNMPIVFYFSIFLMNGRYFLANFFFHLEDPQSSLSKQLAEER